MNDSTLATSARHAPRLIDARTHFAPAARFNSISRSLAVASIWREFGDTRERIVAAAAAAGWPRRDSDRFLIVLSLSLSSETPNAN